MSSGPISSSSIAAAVIRPVRLASGASTIIQSSAESATKIRHTTGVNTQLAFSGEGEGKFAGRMCSLRKSQPKSAAVSTPNSAQAPSDMRKSKTTPALTQPKFSHLDAMTRGR